VHLTFCIDPNWDEIDASSKILTKYHFYVGDNKTHDNMFVQHCFKLCWEFLTLQGFLLHVEHITFFDGCTSQFKCANILFFVAHYPSLTKRDDLPLGRAM
jgi:hypothetical protein